MRYMTLIPSKPQRLYCKHCDETYSLPQGGAIKLYKVRRQAVEVEAKEEGEKEREEGEKEREEEEGEEREGEEVEVRVLIPVVCVQELKCPLDGFEIVLFSDHRGKVSQQSLTNLSTYLLRHFLLLLSLPDLHTMSILLQQAPLSWDH